MSEPTKARPILFNGAMVRAILDGSKTQTRRVMKHPPTPRPVVGLGGPWPSVRKRRAAGWWIWPNALANVLAECPLGIPGDLLWVRETWGPCAGGVCYRASEEPGVCPDGGKWKPSIFMPRWASRITLRITDVRVQRLQDISEDDARAEGIQRQDPTREDLAHGCTAEDFVFVGPGTRQGFGATKALREQPKWAPTAAGAFRCLWDSINAKSAPWASNPWVWAIAFERVVKGARTHE